MIAITTKKFKEKWKNANEQCALLLDILGYDGSQDATIVIFIGNIKMIIRATKNFEILVGLLLPVGNNLFYLLSKILKFYLRSKQRIRETLNPLFVNQAIIIISSVI